LALGMGMAKVKETELGLLWGVGMAREKVMCLDLGTVLQMVMAMGMVSKSVLAADSVLGFACKRMHLLRR
jgi:hypothetical protein